MDKNKEKTKKKIVSRMISTTHESTGYSHEQDGRILLVLWENPMEGRALAESDHNVVEAKRLLSSSSSCREPAPLLERNYAINI